MPWAKIYFPDPEAEARGFYELVRQTRVVSFREAGRGMFQVSTDALQRLRGLGIPFEIAAHLDTPRPDRQPQT